MKKLIPIYIVIFVTFLALVKFGIAHPIIADGRTFAETGKRIVDGYYQNIYDPIIGSGPYIYVPYVSLLFAALHPFAIQTEPYYGFNIYAALSVLAIPAIFYVLCFREKQEDSANDLYTASFVAIYFFGVIWESIYIGQIDLSLMLLLLLAFIVFPGRTIGYAILGIAIAFKPHLSLLFAAQLRENYIKCFAIACLVNLMLLAVFVFITNVDIETILKLFTEFTNKALETSGGIDVTNQSLVADLNRILYSDKFGGRYWPDMLAPNANYQYLGLLKSSGQHLSKSFWVGGVILQLRSYQYCQYIKI